MKRISKKITINNPIEVKQKLLQWAEQFDVFIWLDSNNFKQKYTSYDAVLAVGTEQYLSCNYHNAFEKLKDFQSKVNDYIFGYLSYDLKNDIENLKSRNPDNLDFPDLYFFQPKKIFFLKENTLELRYLKSYQNEMDEDFIEIKKGIPTLKERNKSKKIEIKQRLSKDIYSQKIETILNHIHRGDIYEVNFCQEFYAENTSINPLKVYQNLNKISTPPFASFFKVNDKFLLSASPERFVKKEAFKIISQPIKGTARRLKDKKEDLKIANQLLCDTKERSENIMIVDLVRNDLSKTAIRGSVQVEELCKVYSFKQVHQLVSTVVSKTPEKENTIDIIKSLFPMGSMTGAPKISAMHIIETEESTKRGLYSGAVGYITPNSNFDFNVVIRSILHNKTKKYTSFTVGGAITAKSIVDNEYKECLLKAQAMKQALEEI